MILCGYVLALSLAGGSGSSWLGFAVRRFCRIWPPYALTILASFLIGWVVLAAAPLLPPSPFARVLSARWCGYLGRISYSLYLTHVVVLLGIGAALGNSLSVPLILLVATPIIGIVAWSSHRWIEQPSIQLGRTLAARISRRQSA